VLCVFASSIHSAAGHHHQWALPFAGAGQLARPLQLPEGKGRGGGTMDSGSRSSAGAAGFDDDDGLAPRREVSSSHKGTPPIPLNLLSIRVFRCCRVEQWWGNVFFSLQF
jgi:hypothetical protein